MPIFRFLSGLCVVWGVVCAVTVVSGQDASSQPEINEPPNGARAARRLAQARHALMNLSSLELTLEQQGRLATGVFTSKGRYVAGTFPRIRLEMTTALDGLTGHLLEVCDGQVLWTVREVHGLTTGPTDAAPKDDATSENDADVERTISRRDIDLIRDALDESPKTPQNVLAAELGVGGLPTLLAGLESCFDFRESTDADGRIVLTGRWKQSVFKELRLSPQRGRVPTEVTVTFIGDSPVPVELAYFQHRDDKRVPLLVTRFSDVLQGHTVDPGQFRYVPPSGVEVINRTPDVVADVLETSPD